MNDLHPERIAAGLKFPESPRWWDERLYFSDVYGGKLHTVKADGSELATIVEMDQGPSGLGELPDGRRLVSEQRSRMIWQLPQGDEPLQPFADLRAVSRYWVNDLVTADDGFTYTGTLGHDLLANEPPGPGAIVLTTPEGESRVVATGLEMPNGLAVTPDGGVLLVAETYGDAISAFDRRDDGSLGPRREWAHLPGTNPDGICLDAEGGVWMGSCFTHEFVRVVEGGRITHRIPTPGRWALAPALGGPDRRTLFLLTADTDFERIKVDDIAGFIEAVEVDAPGAGKP
ncbi:SMP-30/gluconolactonase/LRE family protein [Phycicoccus sp. Soil802]|uniref:SMP-30/gluconolactonase/LRE family protein n=1 Tax=Phycicoccus sp. Soil802 TaxID=1736414 RepID=UPI00070333EC|nr:SMP-30/gluconolactonase/LRE family protein [Phycicoccus sp. Soil802]KRF22398.1 hypothetical protein ASG91_19020 [Phycicoccus sp. Soil802]